MAQTKETGRRVAPRTGFQNVFVGTIDNLEFKPFPLDRQAKYLVSRFRISPAYASVVAELAYSGGVAR